MAPLWVYLFSPIVIYLNIIVWPCLISLSLSSAASTIISTEFSSKLQTSHRNSHFNLYSWNSWQQGVWATIPSRGNCPLRLLPTQFYSHTTLFVFYHSSTKNLYTAVAMLDRISLPLFLLAQRVCWCWKFPEDRSPWSALFYYCLTVVISEWMNIHGPIL